MGMIIVNKMKSIVRMIYLIHLKHTGSRIPHYIWSKEGGRFSIRDIIEFCFIVLLFSFILFVIFFSPLLPYLNKQFGDLGVILFLIFILIIFAVINIIYRKKYRK